jgi:O-antigen/teichoic acid export membrane protein
MAETRNNHTYLRLTSGRLLVRNTVLNLVGQGAPLVVALFAIPVLIKGLGTERFGVLTLAWMLIGYFSLFDLGLGRALTKLVADRLGAGREEELPAVVRTSLLLLLLLGAAGSLMVALVSPLLVHRLLKIPAAVQPDALRAFYLLSVSLPLVISAIGLRGVLQAHQRFGLINTVRIALGVFTFLGPLLVLPFSRSLVPVVAVLAVARLFAWLVYLLACLRIIPALGGRARIRRAALGPMLRFGGWITVSNIVSPLMVYLARFFIGALISMTAVTYYVTPYELVTKLSLIPGALTAVLFPAFATSFAQDRQRTAALFVRGVKCLFLVLFPLALVIVALARPGLNLWLGQEFARHSTVVLQLLAVGMFLNCLAHAPFALIQATGRPDLTAKLHLLELPIYLPALWWLTGAYGIVGAAVAWLARVTVDTLLLFGVALWLLPEGAPIFKRVPVTLAAALLTLALARLPMGLVVRGLFLLLMLAAFALGGWLVILSLEERTLIRGQLRAIRVMK